MGRPGRGSLRRLWLAVAHGKQGPVGVESDRVPFVRYRAGRISVA